MAFPSGVVGSYSPPNPARAKGHKPSVLHQGSAHQTAATRTMLGLAHSAVSTLLGGSKRTKGKTHRIKAHTTKSGVQVRGHRAKQRTVKSTGSTAQHFKKGSLAAKRHMSKLRAMRGKKAA